MMRMCKIWDILKEFKNECASLGWQTSENEDWVKADNVFHNFLLSKNVRTSSFEKIVTNGKCVIREETSYHVVEPAYTAWLFSEEPSKNLIMSINENSKRVNKIALYDLSPTLEGQAFCFKLNHTGSHVFREFENFLKKKLNVKIKPFPVDPHESLRDTTIIMETA